MIIVCGEALYDVFVENSQKKDTSNLTLNARVGGSPFNVAVGLARLGQQVGLLAGISSDFLGDQLIENLQTENVSTDFIRRKLAPTTLGFVRQDKAGIPSYAFYGNGAADRQLEKDDTNQDFNQANIIHTGSYAIVTPPTADTILALVRRESSKKIISLDPNIRLNVEPDVELWKSRVAALATYADIIKISDEDIEFLYPGVSPDKIIQHWLNAGTKLAILTQGAHGATLTTNTEKINVSSHKVEIVDTVGAGDTFQAVVLNQIASLLTQGETWHKQLDKTKLTEIGNTAAAAAALTCAKRGADMPTQQTLIAYLNEIK